MVKISDQQIPSAEEYTSFAEEVFEGLPVEGKSDFTVKVLHQVSHGYVTVLLKNEDYAIPRSGEFEVSVEEVLERDASNVVQEICRDVLGYRFCPECNERCWARKDGEEVCPFCEEVAP